MTDRVLHRMADKGTTSDGSPMALRWLSDGSPMEMLTDRELEVFQLIGAGRDTREIAEQLHLGAATVDTYRFRIKDKLRLKNTAELYHRATQWMIEQGG